MKRAINLKRRLQFASQAQETALFLLLGIYTIEIKPEDADVVLPDADVATCNHA